jgi:hypothetical protein
MNKRSKNRFSYAVVFILVFIVPNLFFYYYSKESAETFHRRIAEDNETCWQRAKEDSRETIWCDEIEKSATSAYREARNSNNFYLLPMFQPLLFVLLISLYILRKQVDELKEKIDV